MSILNFKFNPSAESSKEKEDESKPDNDKDQQVENLTGNQVGEDDKDEKKRKENDDIDNIGLRDTTTKREVHFNDGQICNDSLEFSPKVLFLLFFISAVGAVFGTFLWCTYTDSSICPTRGYFYAKAKYLYYYYWVPSDPDVNFY